MSKTIYFVRHGESETNAEKVYKGSAVGITQKGQRQAEFIAERVSGIPVDVVISSDLERAKQTAEIIVQKIQKPIEFSPLFRERRRPSEQLGKSWSDLEFSKIEKEVWDNFSKPSWRYSDEENLDDLKERAGQAIEFLEKRPEENILVVTHGLFMRILICLAIIGNDVNNEICHQFIAKFHTANTGLTILKYDPKSRKTPWWLWVWNDHAHLGE